MKRPIRSAALIFAIALGFGLVPLMGQASDPGSAITAPFEDGTVLAGFRAGVSDANVQAIEQEEGATRTAVIGAGAHVLRVGAGKVAAKIAALKRHQDRGAQAPPRSRRSSATKIAALKRHKEVSYAEPNHLLFADLIFNQLWGLQNTGQSVLGTVGTPGADIKAMPAWNVTTGTRAVVVAVVDTGVDYNHPDLAANIWSAPLLPPPRVRRE